MQTFLPYSNFEKSAKCLDRQRLGKQRVEAYQILRVLSGIGKRNKNGKLAWENHPAVKMWQGYDIVLFEYAHAICDEWIRRRYKDTIKQKLADWFIAQNFGPQAGICYPDWIGDENFHSSHRSNLLRKNKEWYSQFGWTEPDDLEYIWPTKNI